VRNWAVVEDNVAVGNVGASAIEFRHETSWIYYWLAPTARGKGYATRSLIAVCDWAFANGLYRLELGHPISRYPS
jgi:RimJ/RimL family protein N-acetyltransferase